MVRKFSLSKLNTLTDMKKTYSTPSMKVCHIETTNIIAQSLGAGDGIKPLTGEVKEEVIDWDLDGIW